MNKLISKHDIHPDDKRQQVESLYQSIKDIILLARNTAYRAVNFTMVQSYWHIGQQIIEVQCHSRIVMCVCTKRNSERNMIESLKGEERE